MGVQLIEMQQLDEAEVVLLESLTIDPGNELALRELFFIHQLREGNIEPHEMSTYLSRAVPYMDEPRGIPHEKDDET